MGLSWHLLSNGCNMAGLCCCWWCFKCLVHWVVVVPASPCCSCLLSQSTCQFPDIWGVFLRPSLYWLLLRDGEDDISILAVWLAFSLFFCTWLSRGFFLLRISPEDLNFSGPGNNLVAGVFHDVHMHTPLCRALLHYLWTIVVNLYCTLSAHFLSPVFKAAMQTISNLIKQPFYRYEFIQDNEKLEIAFLNIDEM